jgi:hypothetical protein
MATKINPEQRQKKVSSLLKDFYALDGINVSKNEAEKMVSREPTETVYELTQKALDMATKLMEAKGVQNMMSNPIMSSATKSRNDIAMNPRNTPDNEPAQPPKISSNKDANFSEVPPRVVRPLRMGDSIADILGKMYNFMIKKYDSDGVVFKDKQKYNLKLAAIKETRIQELISLFGGKYTKKTFGVQEEKKDSFFDKMLKYVIIGAGLLFFTKAALASVEKKIKDTLPEIPNFSNMFGLGNADNTPNGPTKNLSQLISSVESGGDYDIYNKGKAGVTGPPLKLSEMTVGKIMELQSQGKIFAAGKYQIIPNTLKGAVETGIVTKDEQFSPDTQERLFSSYLIGSKNPDIKKYLNSTNPDEQMKFNALLALSKEFAALPDPRTGKSHYAGDKAGNTAGATLSQTEKALENDRLLNLEQTKQQTKETATQSENLSPKVLNVPQKQKQDDVTKTQSVSVLNRNINNINNVTYGSDEGAVEHSPLIQRQYYS